MAATLRQAAREVYTYVTVAHSCGCRFTSDAHSETAAALEAESVQRSWTRRGSDTVVYVASVGVERRCQAHRPVSA